MTQDTSVFNVGIVGGGKVGLQLLEMFHQSQLTHVGFVVDVADRAPAILVAREIGVPVFTNFDAAFQSVTVDYVFEVTGSHSVALKLVEAVRHTSTKVVTSDVAYVILKVVEDSDAKVRALVCDEICGIRQEMSGSFANIDGLVSNMRRILSDMQILAINARIEAARAGETGAGFAVVAEAMQKSSASVQQAANEIERVSAGVVSATQRIDSSLQRLQY